MSGVYQRNREVSEYKFFTQAIDWWLRSVMGGSSSNVCYVNNNGNANYNSATNTWVRPRPGLPYCQTE